jgi:mono/diheme cytochrome c family protein
MLYSPRSTNPQIKTAFTGENWMKFDKLIFISAFIVVFAAGCGTNSNTDPVTQPTSSASPATAATATPDEFASVRPIYKEKCAKCHGDSGEGGQVTVDGKKLRVPSYKSDHALKHKDEDFVDQIVTGGDGMPAFKGKLEPTQINDLVRFIRKEFQNR